MRSVLLAIAVAAFWSAGQAQDRFTFDTQKAQRAARINGDFAKMIQCVIDNTPEIIEEGMRSRATIRAHVRALCVADLVADGFYSNARVTRMCDLLTDREIDAILAANR